MDKITKLNKPDLPEKWEYNNSIDLVKTNIYKWKNLTIDIANELWIARKMIKEKRKRTTTGTFVPMDKTWTEYCEEIGSSKQVVNRWLKQWFEQTHVSQNTGENEWYTPDKIIESARNTMKNIDLDPATSPVANEKIKAEQIFTKEDNGLIQTWNGNIWMNPPYSQPLITQFSDKLIKELPNIKQACILVNNATETNWLQNMIKECSAICFLKGRVKFVDMEGKSTGAPLQGQVILYFGNNINKFYDNFKQFGICMTIIEVQ